MSGILDTTMGTQFVPGSNLLPHEPPAPWRFLVPDLGIRRAIWVGTVDGTTLEELTRSAGQVLVVCGSEAEAARVTRAARRCTSGVVGPVVAGHDLVLPVGWADVMLLAGRSAWALAGRFPLLLGELARALGHDGFLYADALPPGRGGRDAVARLSAALGPARRLRLFPAPGGQMRLAPLREGRPVPARGGPPSGGVLAGSKAALRLLGEGGPAAMRPRTAAVIVPGTDEPASPPRYLRAIAADYGVDIGGLNWTLTVPGVYRSKKVLFFLSADGDTRPTYVVKLTQHPALNDRIENAWSALDGLSRRPSGLGAVLPRPAFFGYSGGLAVMGETVVAGDPFRARSRADASCPYAGAAVGWLLDLAEQTADPIPARVAAETLEILLDRFRVLYQPPRPHLRFLKEQIASIGDSAAHFPRVYQHGDPGTWNVVVTPDERVSFLDWEAAEPRGMPLWDLFYFMRSFGVLVARTPGRRGSMAAFAHEYLADSPTGRLLAEATAAFCARTELAPALVEPLFHTCWMHRALKEATRLHPGRMHEGHYVNLLAASIDHRDSPGLRRLFGAGSRP